MKNSKIFLSVIIISLVLLNTGCIGVNKGFRDLRSKIIDNVDGDFDRVVEFSVGSAGIMLASAFVSFADDDADVDVGEMLSEISRVQVGVYERMDHKTNPSLSLLKEITDEMENEGWKYIVRSIDGDEMVSIFIQEEDNETIQQMFVVALSDDELVMTEIHGDLGAVVEVAVRDHGNHFKVKHDY